MTFQVNGKASQSKTMFRMEVGVGITINASAEKVWALLTNAGDFPRWNSTVQRIEGTIGPQQTIQLTAKINPQRVFKLKITEFTPGRSLVWQDGMAPMFQGIRRYTLRPNGSSTDFTMVETFSGLMLPMIAGSLPDFRPSFEQYARDLRQEAERKS